MMRMRRIVEKSLADWLRDVSTAPVVLLCAVVVGGGESAYSQSTMPEEKEVDELPTSATVEDALNQLRVLEENFADLEDGLDSGWLLAIQDPSRRGLLMVQAEGVLRDAKWTEDTVVAALDGHSDDVDQVIIDRLVQANVALIPLRAARAALTFDIANGETDELVDGLGLAEASEGVSAWTRAERAVLLAQGWALAGEGDEALRVLGGAQEELRGATREQRIEALLALVVATADVQGLAAAEGAWLRIVERSPFVDAEGHVDVSAKAMAISVMTRLRLMYGNSRTSALREGSDMLSKLLAEARGETRLVFEQLRLLGLQYASFDDAPMPVVLGLLVDGDFMDRELLNTLCHVDLGTVPAGDARREVLLTAAAVLSKQTDVLFRGCAADMVLALLEDHAGDERVLRLTGLLVSMASELVSQDRIVRAKQIEEKIAPGAAKGQIRLAIAYAMAEMWDGAGNPPDVDVVLNELYTDELRERGVEFRRRFWKSVLVREEDRVAAGGEMGELAWEAAVRLYLAARVGPRDDLGLFHSYIVTSTRWTDLEERVPDGNTLTDGADSYLKWQPEIGPAEMTEYQALRARWVMIQGRDVSDALRVLVQRDAEVAKRTWRVMLLFDGRCDNDRSEPRVFAAGSDPDKKTILLAARWGVEEQGYALMAGMRDVLLRCSASARDAEMARWVAETVADDVRGVEERLLLGEAWMTAGEEEKAFAVYREIGLDLESDDPREYAYWAAYARMLQILAGRDDDGSRRAEIVREVNRLRTLPGYDIHEGARRVIDEVGRGVGI